jgi:hypothetical protein
VFRCRLHSPDGDDPGEATYAVLIKPGEEIHLGAGQRFCVLDRCAVRGGGRVAVRGAATGRGGFTLTLEPDHRVTYGSKVSGC